MRVCGSVCLISKHATTIHIIRNEMIARERETLIKTLLNFFRAYHCTVPIDCTFIYKHSNYSKYLFSSILLYIQNTVCFHHDSASGTSSFRSTVQYDQNVRRNN